MTSTRADRLRKARRNEGFTSASVAARSLGVSPSTYIHHENGTRDFGEEAGALYARRYHVTLAWLMLGEGEMETPDLADEKKEAIEARQREEQIYREARESVPSEVRAEMRENSQRMEEKKILDIAKGLTFLPEISPFWKKDDSMLLRGWERYVALDETVVHPITAHWGIPAKHLAFEMGASPQTILFPISGDANAPSLVHGDLVFVDTATDDVVADGLYLVADKVGYPQVRRIQANLFSTPATLTISSDGSPETRQVVEVQTVTIVGKLVGRLTRM